jgi:hypothetical protein
LPDGLDWPIGNACFEADWLAKSPLGHPTRRPGASYTTTKEQVIPPSEVTLFCDFVCTQLDNVVRMATFFREELFPLGKIQAS